MKNIEGMLDLFKKKLEEEYGDETDNYRASFRMFHHRFERKNFEFFLEFLQKRGMVKESISLCEVLGFYYPMEIVDYLFSYLNLDSVDRKIFEEMLKTGELVICPNSLEYKKDLYKIWVRIRSDGAAHLLESLKWQLFPKITRLFFVNQSGNPKIFFLLFNSAVLLHNLEELSAPNCNLMHFGVDCILKLKSLTCLDLNENLIDDKDLAKIATLSKLKSLNLTKNKLTLRGLGSLLKLSDLRYLVLSGNNLDDGALIHLVLMTQLERLDITRNPISKPGIEILIKSLTNCHIIRTPSLKII